MTHAVLVLVRILSRYPVGDSRRFLLSHSVVGLTIKMQIIGAHTAKATDTISGRTMVTALMLALEPPRFEMIRTITRPTTSSIIAALVKTTPSLLFISPLDPRTVNVVPRLVEHSAAPAANACRGVAPVRLCRTKESPNGKATPVTATHEESHRLAFNDRREVERPPAIVRE